MNIQITGKDLKATEAIKNYVEKKLERIEKYFDTEDMEVFVTIKTERELQIAELSVVYKGERFRAVTEHKDLYASIDKDIDVLEGQIRKAKTKKERQNKEDSIKLKEIANLSDRNEISGEIIKALYYEIKPISVDDAKLKLQEKPTNNFLTFINVDTNKVNVIFKLKDGKNYGLVEPEA
ncbi:MAG: ribosome-associated translation inhibitor RaiA [Clostridia bacterium]|nr:ribosome-associated translation inhibitor RaiA [Clostridia bacterium]MBR3152220.1 ribosome-associated translation inhibitor RaiA [Clostridia bacterium]MBR3152243.1 ribosome-associated translation inhibitor RaiA [Clostridia bacterium]